MHARCCGVQSFSPPSKRLAKIKKYIFHVHLLHVSDYNHLNAFIYHFVSNERQRNIFGMNEN